MSGPPSPDLNALLYQMAVGQGQIIASLARIEAAIAKQPEAETDWGTLVKAGRLIARAASWTVRAYRALRMVPWGVIFLMAVAAWKFVLGFFG